MKETETRPRGDCRTCNWYDPLVDICRNPERQNGQILPIPKSGCALWRTDRRPA